MKRILKISSVISFFFLSFSFHAGAQEPKISRVPLPVKSSQISADQTRRLRAFQIVWATIAENYFDQTFNGLNWDEVRLEFEPRAKAAKNDRELHFLLQEMINRLARSHFSLIPPEVAKELENVKREAAASASDQNDIDEEDDVEEPIDDGDDETEINADSIYGIGIEVRVFGNDIVVSAVEPVSPAEKAGIRTGFVIEGVNDLLFADFIKKITDLGSYAKSVEKQLPLEIVAWFFNSRTRSELSLRIIDNENRRQTLQIQREKLSGELERLVPNLPKQFLRFEERSLTDDIGYLKFNFFTISTVDKFCDAMTKFKDKRALIIDLRGNLGGSYGTVIGIGGLLTQKQIKMGTEIHRSGSFSREINPHRKNFKGDIVILVDKLSYSAAEIFASALQENGIATVIGEQTAGEALPAVTKILPTGAIFLYPVANFKSPRGNLLEGRGVVPDIVLRNDLISLRKQQDRQLSAAIAEANRKIAEKTAKNPNLNKNDLPNAAASTVKRALPSKRVKPIQDEKALQIILDSINSIGGADELRKITSYTASGNLTIVDSGTEVKGRIEIFRRAPDKFAENLFIEGSGEIREVFNGKDHFVQSKIFGTDQTVQPAQVNELKLLADFYEILNAKSIYPKIIYRGEFERENRQVHLIEATDVNGSNVMFVFDVETGRLVNRTGTSTVNSFGDYRKVGQIFFPFWQSRTDTIVYMLNEVKFNVEIGDEVFEAAVNCFDKID